MKAPPEDDRKRAARDKYDHSDTESDALTKALVEAASVLNEMEVEYALIGGLASRGVGRPRKTNDIDLFVRADDAERILKAMGERGFKIERRDPSWLFKAWKHDVLIDIIFKSSGDIYFDSEIAAHTRTIEILGSSIRVIGPEDYVILKASAHVEDAPHWYDALAVLREPVDWKYLLKRARLSPRRVLALLIYAETEDIRIPSWVIRSLFHELYETKPATERQPISEEDHARAKSFEARIRETLARNHAISGIEVQVHLAENKIFLRGELTTEDQRRLTRETVQALFPNAQVVDQLQVMSLPQPEPHSQQDL